MHTLKEPVLVRAVPQAPQHHQLQRPTDSPLTCKEHSQNKALKISCRVHVPGSWISSTGSLYVLRCPDSIHDTHALGVHHRLPHLGWCCSLARQAAPLACRTVCTTAGDRVPDVQQLLHTPISFRSCTAEHPAALVQDVMAVVMPVVQRHSLASLSFNACARPVRVARLHRLQ